MAEKRPREGAEQSKNGRDFDKAGHTTDRMKVLNRHSLAEMLLMSDISKHIEILLNVNDRYWLYDENDE
jgi:hypothetical protein